MLESLFDKGAGLQSCNFIKKRLQHTSFPVNIGKFLRTVFCTEHFRWMHMNHNYEIFVLLTFTLHACPARIPHRLTCAHMSVK